MIKWRHDINHISGDMLYVTIIIEGNGIGDLSSNPRQGCLQFPL